MDVDQEVGINEGMSLGVLIEERRIPLNSAARGQAICSELVKINMKLPPVYLLQF